VEHNDHAAKMNLVTLGAATLWNRAAQNRLEEIMRSEKPEVVHFHNTFPLISPAAYYTAKRFGAAVVQTLHNYRLICANATLFRDGRPCEECISARSPRPAIQHGCYRKNRLATLGVTSMVQLHRALRTWSNQVDAYITLNEFSRNKLSEGGLPASKMFVKPNFVAAKPDPGTGGGAYALFIARLVEEKGVRTLLDAWERISDVPLKIIGQGPLADSRCSANIGWLGRLESHGDLLEEMKGASVLVVPSLWYEVAPGIILEAFATGLPVIASNMGAMASMIAHGRTGLLFRPGDPEDLARQVRWAVEHPEELLEMRANARREYEEKYTAERNYKMLMTIYQMAIENSERRRREAS